MRQGKPPGLVALLLWGERAMVMDWAQRRFAGRPACHVRRLAIAVLLTACSMPGSAQTASVRTVPTREEIAPPLPATPPSRTRLKVEGGIERSACALADPAYAAIMVTLTEVSFNNLGPVAAGDLADTYRPYIGRAVPIGTVCEIRDAAATLLRARGYLAAVQVPAQRIEGGKVRFEVLYARMTAVRVRGDAGRDEHQVARYLTHLAGGGPFNTIAAERYLLLTRDLPGLDVRLALKPAGTAPGDMIGEVTVRRTPIEIDANIQNYAPHENGPFGGQLRAQVNGLTGLGDRTTLSVYSTSDFDEQQVVQFGHDMAIGSEGLRLGGHFTYAWTHPGIGGTAPNIRAKTLFANVEATYPFIRSQRLTLAGGAGFDFVNQDVTFGGAPLSQDNLRVAYARLDFDAADTRDRGPGGTSWWHMAGSLEVRQGIDALGASPACGGNPRCAVPGFVPPSLFIGDPTATLVRFTGLAEARVAKNVSLILLPRGQLASAPVYAFEQISGGNYTIGRGYDPGAITGDDGVGFTAEARIDRLKLLTSQNISLQPYAFVDSIWLWKRGGVAATNPRQLASAGGGARLTWANHVKLDLTVAVPLRSNDSVRSGDVRVLMSLTTRLVPWRTR